MRETELEEMAAINDLRTGDIEMRLKLKIGLSGGLIIGGRERIGFGQLYKNTKGRVIEE